MVVLLIPSLLLVWIGMALLSGRMFSTRSGRQAVAWAFSTCIFPVAILGVGVLFGRRGGSASYQEMGIYTLLFLQACTSIWLIVKLRGFRWRVAPILLLAALGSLWTWTLAVMVITGYSL